MRARVLAIIAAVVLIGGAVLVRSAITDDGNDGPSCADEAKTVEDCAGGGGGGGSDRPRVACTRDLDDVCDALAADGAITKVAAVDLDHAVDRAKELDGWITYAAAPTIVGYDVSDDPKQGPYDVSPTPIASARLTAVVPPGSAGAVGAACLQSPTWTCLDAGVQSGKVPLAVGRSAPMSAAGIASLTPLAEAGRYGNDDVDPVAAFAAVAPTYAKALDAGALPSGSVDQQLTSLVTKPGVTDVVVAPDALAKVAAQQAERRGSGTVLRSLHAGPAASAVVVLASTGTGSLSNDVEAALVGDGAPARALAKLGFRIDPHAKVPGTDEAGFLYQVWKALD